MYVKPSGEISYFSARSVVSSPKGVALKSPEKVKAVISRSASEMASNGLMNLGEPTVPSTILPPLDGTVTDRVSFASANIKRVDSVIAATKR